MHEHYTPIGIHHKLLAFYGKILWVTGWDNQGTAAEIWAWITSCDLDGQSVQLTIWTDNLASVSEIIAGLG
jgi:hypothetical protein